MVYGVPAKRFGKQLWHKVNDDDVFTGAAALAYYLTLAIFPALIFTMALIPYLPIERVDEAIMNFVGQALPQEAYGLVAGVVQDVTSERRGGLLSFGLIAALWATSTGMYAVMRQMNIIYRVAEARSFIRARLTALALSVMFILLVIGAFSLVVFGGVIEDWIGSRWGYHGLLVTFFAVFRWVVIICALLLAFASIYYWAPNLKEERFRFFSPGAFVGVALLLAGALLFSLYASNFANYDATYGSIGAVILLMLWLYVAGVVILFGAVLNMVLRRQRERSEYEPDQRGQRPAESGA